MTASMNALTFATIPRDAGLRRAMQMPRADVIGEIDAAGLRGRGGAGFPTAGKWNLCAAAIADEKFIVCNADEGEPGTFKDRLILGEHADLVFEGMTIAARAVGATRGLVYLRGEYRYLLAPLRAVLGRRRHEKLLGRAILGDEAFEFDVEIRLGAGAYVCGEETALIESLEGFRGEPRNRPPFPVDTGFLGQPSVVNNVETFAWAASILARGAEWFKSAGTAKSAGIKLFSVSGDCARPGVYELPFGMPITQLLALVGGENARAVLVGGASGVCVPAAEFERRLAFEDLSTGGAIVVIGPERDLLAVARTLLEFFVDESCGQCTPCRGGNPRLLEGVELLQEGRCSMEYLRELLALGETMQLASKCGLGQSSPNAFLSIVKHFGDDIIGRVQRPT